MGMAPKYDCHGEDRRLATLKGFPWSKVGTGTTTVVHALDGVS